MAKTIKHVCYIDSISDGIARLIFDAGGDMFSPAALLPASAKEGDVIILTFQIDNEASKKSKNDIDNLYEKLEDNP